MKFFRKRKLAKYLDSKDVLGLLSMLHDTDQEISTKAWKGFQQAINKKPKWLTKKAVYTELVKLTKAKSNSIQTTARELLYRSAHPGLVDEAMETALRNPLKPEGRLAFDYLVRSMDTNTDKLRKAFGEVEELDLSLLSVLKSVESISDPLAKGTIGFISFLNLWDNRDIYRECFQLFCRSSFSEDKETMNQLLERLLPLMKGELTAPMLYKHGADPENKDFEKLAEDTILTIGLEAKDYLVRIVEEYKDTVVPQRRAKTQRTPGYYASQKALDMLGEVIVKGDDKLVMFLTGIVGDTKFDDSGLHKRRARDLLVRYT